LLAHALEDFAEWFELPFFLSASSAQASVYFVVHFEASVDIDDLLVVSVGSIAERVDGID
jgi:hypothetical protein